MPTNRRRVRRLSRFYTLAELSDEQRGDLTMKDFLGLLSEDEIPIARTHGLLKWDAWAKARRARRLAWEAQNTPKGESDER